MVVWSSTLIFYVDHPIFCNLVEHPVVQKGTPCLVIINIGYVVTVMALCFSVVTIFGQVVRCCLLYKELYILGLENLRVI